MKAGVVIVRACKVDFRVKKIMKDKKGILHNDKKWLKKFNSSMINNDNDKNQNSTHQEDIKIPNVYAPNKTSSKYM